MNMLDRLAPLVERPAPPATSEAESPEAATLAGRYHLERALGCGGMGTVHEATDTALGRKVAVKLIREDLLGSRDAAERFRREAQAVAAFSHPNVVTIFDFGVDAGGRAFLVMELLDGEDLGDALRRDGRFSPSRTLEVLRGVCAAVDAAHRRRLVHRDIKPANVFLARGEAGEVPKVLDFGVAKFLPGPEGPEAETATRALVGTPRYMAPEQIAGGRPRPSWDVWALAVMAYEMLIGAHPFEGSGTERAASLLAGRFASPERHHPGAPPSWQAFFARALAPDAAHRPGSAGSLLASLAEALHESP